MGLDVDAEREMQRAAKRQGSLMKPWIMETDQMRGHDNTVLEQVIND